MTNEILTELLQSVGVLGVFLLIGTFLRAKIKIFQDTFLPASVIGGFLLLILGPNCLGILPIPQEWINIYSLIPGILIVPVVTATPLGMTLKKSGSGEKGGNSAVNAAILGFVLLGVGLLQFAIGFGTHAAFSVGGAELYDTFGWEMGLGYSGGHGTAALLGNMLQQAGLPYWETAQGVGVTAATFGLVGGILIGICMINWAARTGRTVYLSEPAAIPQALKTGYERDPQRQGSIGKETTYSSSIDTLAGMSQRADVAREAPIPGQDQGHGCGHCQLGTASAAAALMIRDYLRDTERSGTVIFFGCPAEEGGGGKTFMARSGVFDQLDAALTWHPANAYFVMTGSFQANCQAYFRFQGVTSHAAASPHLGRSALDAVELMNVGANYLREHMDPDDCFHYAMTDNGGSSPNVVPAHAEVIYLMRSRTSEKVADRKSVV